MRAVARGIHAVSGGRVTPNMVTWFGLIMHIPAAYCIASGKLAAAGVLLVVFGLFDTLDGELARLQKRVSNLGGFLDASTDRLKEVLIYSGMAYLFASGSEPRWAAVPAAAVGASICVSYVKAKGEAVVAAQKEKIPYPELNRMFGGGLFPFEVRMFVIVVGLFAGYLLPAALITGVFSIVTVLQRMYLIGRRIA